MKTSVRFAAPLPACIVLTSVAVFAAAPANPARKKVAILLFNGVEIIDYTAGRPQG